MLFDSWAGIGRTILVGALAYVALVLMLRISGNRTLSKMSAFDLIVTVALGSTLATVLLTQDVALAEGVTAFALLIALQFAVTWLSVRIEPFHHLVTAEPVLLLYAGEPLPDAMRRARVTDNDLFAALRQQGCASPDDAGAVILEADGAFTVLPRSAGSMPTLADVRGAPGQPPDATG